MEQYHKPLLSISCITYNHAAYIKECLDSFLMQVTTFPFEIVIHDDCSTDGTKEIIEEYVLKYPGKFFPIYQKENQHSKGVRVTPTFNYPRCRGKYIALCEGDDYWTDPYKLQKQVDFLESNPDFVICGHDAKIIDAEGNITQDSKLPDFAKKDATQEDLKKGVWILTLSMVFRNLPILRKYPKEGAKVVNGDTFLTSILGEYGKYKYLETIEPAVYRMHGAGVWSMKTTKEKSMHHIKTIFYMAKYHKKKDRETSAELFSRCFTRSHSMFISGLGEKHEFSKQFYILKYTILSHYEINGTKDALVFALKKIGRLIHSSSFGAAK